MATEIERKFLVKNDNWKSQVTKQKHLVQGYLSGSEHSSIRVRISGESAHLNIKSTTLALTRKEYEYPIPLQDAQEILAELCQKPMIEKTRYYIKDQEFVWEVDVFAGENQGLVVAEIELNSADQKYPRPDWLGEEVSDDPRYYNVSLLKHPFKDW